MPKPKYYILILILVLMGSYIFLEATANKPIDWSESYWKTHKKPFGAEVFNEIFTKHQNQINEIDQSAYEFLSEAEYEGSYLFFNRGLNIGQYDMEKVIDWVNKGNTLFMSAEYLPSLLLDTIGLKKVQFSFNDQISYKPSFIFDTLSEINEYKFDRNQNVQYFKNTDTLDVKVLGYTKLINKDSTETKILPNFIKSEFGTGDIYIHLFPKAFTNFFLLDRNNIEYTEEILSYLDYNKTLYIDQYYKDQREEPKKHILQYLVGNRYLKWAYYLILLTGIIYIFFEGKRKQKPIKILKPYENKTYAFTKTISDMYFRKQDHKSIATKMIEHFYDYIRDQYHISTQVLDDDFVHHLASKSGQDIKHIRTLLKQIDYIEKQPQISKQVLLRLEKQISNIKS